MEQRLFELLFMSEGAEMKLHSSLSITSKSLKVPECL